MVYEVHQARELEANNANSWDTLATLVVPGQQGIKVKQILLVRRANRLMQQSRNAHVQGNNVQPVPYIF